MNNKCIDIDYSQVYKNGQSIGGDVYLIKINEDHNRIAAALSDGLGSGVKANVLANLTAHMCLKFSFSPLDLVHSAEIIMDTLPVDKAKGISYSTFTFADIRYSADKSDIKVSLVEYDNPPTLRFRGHRPLEWDKAAHTLNRLAAVKQEVVYSSDFDMEIGDRLIFFSDGVAQAGVGLGPGHAREIGIGPKGWGMESVQQFISEEIRKDPEISSRQLARNIVTRALRYDGNKANDDITCAVVCVRKPKRALVITGAPNDPSADAMLAETVRNYDGKVILCGGTTASIISRELGVPIKRDPQPSGNLPPTSLIEGIDLVTEGIVTLNEIADRLDNKVLLKDMPNDAARRFIAIMREVDQVEFIVGTSINEATAKDPGLQTYGIRLPLISRLKRMFEDKYLMEVDIRYV